MLLPKKIVEHFSNVDYFNVRKEQGRIVLLPVLYNHIVAPDVFFETGRDTHWALTSHL